MSFLIGAGGAAAFFAFLTIGMWLAEIGWELAVRAHHTEPYEPLAPDPSGLPVEVLEFQGHTWSWVGLSVEDREWLDGIGTGGLKW